LAAEKLRNLTRIIPEASSTSANITLYRFWGKCISYRECKKQQGSKKGWVWAFVTVVLLYSQSRGKFLVCLNQSIYSCYEDELKGFLSFLGYLGTYLL